MPSGSDSRQTATAFGRRVLREVATLVTPDTILRWHRQLIARKWTARRRRVGRPGVLHEIRLLTVRMARVRVAQTPYRAPNCNAHAERFVRSIKEECLNRLVFLGEAHLRQTLTEFATHYHRERNHQGFHNRLIIPAPTGSPHSRVRCRARLGGLLRYYYRAA